MRRAEPLEGEVLSEEATKDEDEEESDEDEEKGVGVMAKSAKKISEKLSTRGTKRFSAYWPTLGSDRLPEVDDAVFVSRTLDTSSGREFYEARLTPWKTNVSHEPKVHGWLGETNNKSRTAVGKGVVTAIDPDRDDVIRFRFVKGAAS